MRNKKTVKKEHVLLFCNCIKQDLLISIISRLHFKGYIPCFAIRFFLFFNNTKLLDGLFFVLLRFNKSCCHHLTSLF